MLVADDDRLIVATLGQRLRSAGYEVIEAFDGPSALAACASSQPDLAVIDHSMPGMTGVEVARALAASGGVPVIFLSAYSDETIVDDAVASGAITYIVKPIDTEQLLPIVRAALQRAREIRALREQNERLRVSLTGEQSVSAAAGLLMASLKLGQREAFERLRHRARSQRVKLEDVAAQLLRAHDEAGKILQEYAAPLRPPKSGETDPR